MFTQFNARVAFRFDLINQEMFSFTNKIKKIKIEDKIKLQIACSKAVYFRVVYKHDRARVILKSHHTMIPSSQVVIAYAVQLGLMILKTLSTFS